MLFLLFIFLDIIQSLIQMLIILSFFLLWDYLLRHNFFSNFLSHFFIFINTYVIIIHENILISTEYPVYRIKDNPRKQPTPILFASDGGQTCRQREMVTDALPYNLRWNLMREFGVRLYAIYVKSRMHSYVYLQAVRSRRRRQSAWTALLRDKATVSVLSGPNRANQPPTVLALPLCVYL